MEGPRDISCTGRCRETSASWSVCTESEYAKGLDGFYHGRKRENMGVSDMDVNLERSPGCDNECAELA